MGNTTGNIRETLERAARLLNQCVEQLAGQSPELAEQVASLAGGVFDVSASCVPERSEGPSEACSAPTVVDRLLGVVFRGVSHSAAPRSSRLIGHAV